jgi:hypothetical protein
MNNDASFEDVETGRKWMVNVGNVTFAKVDHAFGVGNLFRRI